MPTTLPLVFAFAYANKCVMDKVRSNGEKQIKRKQRCVNSSGLVSFRIAVQKQTTESFEFVNISSSFFFEGKSKALEMKSDYDCY